VNLDPLLEQLAELVAEKVAARLNGKEQPPDRTAHGTDGEPLLDAKAVAEQLGTSARWVYDHAQELGGKRLTRRCLRFPEGAVRRYVERHR
jgi:predicted DNA-binding transcriptional regulator AlpA